MLTALNLGFTFIGVKGASAIAEALKENSSLTELNLVGIELYDEGVSAIAKSLINHPSILKLIVRREYRTYFNEVPNSGINTQSYLKDLLEVLIVEDGVQVLANKFRMKLAVVIEW